MSLLKKTQSRRFITLIDTFYDNNVRVLFSAEVPLKQLFLTNKIYDLSIIDENRKLMDDLDIKLGTVSFNWFYCLLSFELSLFLGTFKCEYI